MNASPVALSRRLRRNHKSFVYIELHGSSIVKGAEEDLVDALHQNKTVEFVCLQRLSVEQQTIILPAVSGLPLLQRIHLCNFATTVLQARGLESMIRKANNLKELTLECSRLYGSKDDIANLAVVMKTHPTLKQVVFRRCCSANEEAKVDPLFESLSASRSIEELTFDGSNVLKDTNKAKTNLCKGTFQKLEEDLTVSNTSLSLLCSSPTLKVLNLCYIPLNDKHLIRMIAKGLMNNKCLQTLNCTWCRLGDSGALALAGILRVNQFLDTLHLYNNCIGDAGCAAMANSLKQNKTVKRLVFNERGISRKACGIFFDMLRQNHTLEDLSMNCTCFELRGKFDFLLAAKQDLFHDIRDTHRGREKLILTLSSARNDLDCLFSVLSMTPSLWTRNAYA